MLSVLPLKRPGMLPGKVPLNEKAGFFRPRNQWAKCVAWEPERGSDPETGGLGRQFSFFRSGRINCLLGEQQWPSTTCSLARCSQRRCGHERRFARSSVCCVFHSFLQACCQQEKENIFFPRAVRQEKPDAPILTESLQQIHGKILIRHQHTWCYVSNQRRKLSKKKASCQNWQRILGHVKVQPPRWEAVRQECLVWHWC